MTLTYPMLNRSRRILWLVTGSDKVEAFARLRDGDASIPAGRIQRDKAVVLADRAAVGEKLRGKKIGSGRRATTKDTKSTN